MIELVRRYLTAEAVYPPGAPELREAERRLQAALEKLPDAETQIGKLHVRLEVGSMAGKQFRYVIFTGELPRIEHGSTLRASIPWRHTAADFRR